MKKIMKFTAYLLGVLTTVGLISCGDDDDEKNECCTYTESYNNISYTYRACEDGTYSITGSDGSFFSDTWDTSNYNWDELKTEAIRDYGATCS